MASSRLSPPRLRPATETFGYMRSVNVVRRAILAEINRSMTTPSMVRLKKVTPSAFLCASVNWRFFSVVSVIG